MMDQLKVGIAGYGVVGKRRREYIDAHPALRTVAVSDTTMRGDGVFDDGVTFFDDYSKLLDENLDVLFVCLSNDVASSATVGGLKRGFHVFCEKPPGRDMSDIAAVANEAAARPTQIVKYGFNHRYHHAIRDALEIVQSGALGDIINLYGLYGKSKLISWGQTTWRTEREKAGGGILLDQGIHMVDLMRLFAGDFTDVKSVISNNHWQKNVEDNAYALMTTTDGKVAMLHSSATSWRHRFNLNITMTRGSLSLSGILSGSKSYGDETLTIAYAADDESGDPREETRHYDDDPSWAAEIEEFANAVTSGGVIHNGSIEDAYKTMELVYRIYCADEEWRQKWNLSWQP